jgi:hypothetical protein
MGYFSSGDLFDESLSVYKSDRLLLFDSLARLGSKHTELG